MRRHLVLVLFCIIAITGYAQKIVRYDLYVTDTIVNYTGKNRKAIAVNGQIPMPTLYFTEGDSVVVHVHNKMHHETSIHWHGLLLPNEQDGVPYLTTAPIKAHSTHTYNFKIRQNGTYWYHSHTMLQEQVGMYGAIVIRKPKQPVINEEVILLSDWSDENPNEIERSLHTANDWYMIKKNSVQSYGEAIKTGYLGAKLTNEWKRMNAMDVSDVYYEKFLVNGKSEEEKKQYKAGDKVRLRLINGSASTYFWIRYSGGKISVVASDGTDVEPVEVDRLLIGVSETYDIVATVPSDSTSYELMATSEDRTGSTSFWLGNGTKHPISPLPRLNYFEGMKMMNNMMTTSGNMKDMGMNMSLQQMDMNAVMYPEITGEEPPKKDHKDNHMDMDEPKDIITLNYTMLKSPVKTTLPDVPFRTLHFELTGNMNRYVWTLDNKTVSESDKILIKKGENIRIVLTNNSMMRHPMHLHGHFFRVINGQGDYAPLKNVLDIMPMETDTIEFNAAEEYGNWYFHCHILYHMMSGMGRIFSYEDSPPNPQLPDAKMALNRVYRDDKRFFLSAQNDFATNGNDGQLRYENTRWGIQSEWRLGYNDIDGYEAEAHVGRYIGKMQWLFTYVGFDWRYRKLTGDRRETNLFGQVNTKDQRQAFYIGAQYTLPMLIMADARIDTDGKARIQLRREDIPITKRLRLWGMLNTDVEYAVGARYILTKYVAASSHYDSDMGFGVGFTLKY